MTREGKDKRHKTSPSPTQLAHGIVVDIPLDLTVEILKKLPTKSLVRFQCVSKLWSSIISSRRDFIDSIVTRSQPPRDALLMYNYYSGKSFIAFVSTTNKETESVSREYFQHQFVRGLICSWSQSFRPTMESAAIYNPTTKQSFNLPKLKVPEDVSDYLFGYDPLENQYKVVHPSSCQVFTLGDSQWRKIQVTDRPKGLVRSAVCINGTIYYHEVTSFNNRLMSFDVRYEKFIHVGAPKEIQLVCPLFPINYLDKLGFICCEKGVEIWVMESQGWSKILFCEMDGFLNLRILGATRGGEIMFEDYKDRYEDDSKLRVYYYDPTRNSMRCVHLNDYCKEKGRHRICFTVPDYAENTMRLK